MRLVMEALCLMAAVSVVIWICMAKHEDRIAGGKTYRLPVTAENTDGYGL